VERERTYPSDLTDEQWAVIEVMLPLPKWAGQPEKHPRRAIVDAILYVVSEWVPDPKDAIKNPAIPTKPWDRFKYGLARFLDIWF
jgi:transposase